MSWITPELLDALRMVESSGNNNAVSSAGAVGEYQFMPQYTHNMGYGVPSFDPKDPAQARNAAAKFLSGMQKHHNWTPEQTLQAYNWGPGNMKQYLAGTKDMPTETSDYVSKFSKFGWEPQKMVASLSPDSTTEKVKISSAIPKVEKTSTVSSFIKDVFEGSGSGKPKMEITQLIPKSHKDIFNVFMPEPEEQYDDTASLEQAIVDMHKKDSKAFASVPEQTMVSDPNTNTPPKRKDFFSSFWYEFTKDAET
tara:strand:+ start:78 stop:833 length:756 start_codon:yes stop_codon:yes gene_type:complete